MIYEILESIFIFIVMLDLVVAFMARFKYKLINTITYICYSSIAFIALMTMIKGV